MECLSACKRTRYKLYWPPQTPGGNTELWWWREFSDTRANFVNSLSFPLSTSSLHLFVCFFLCVFFVWFFLWFVSCPDNTVQIQIQCTMKENVMDIVHMFREIIFHVLAITLNTKTGFWNYEMTNCYNTVFIYFKFLFYKLMTVNRNVFKLISIIRIIEP